MSKKKLRKQVAVLEAQLADLRLPPPPTFDNLEIDWVHRTVRWRGRLIETDPNHNIIVFPVTNQEHLLARAGWYPIYP